MPLVKGKSNAAFKANVGTLMGEIGKSPHVQSRAQALAIAFHKKRTGKQYGGAIGKAEGGWLDFLRPKPRAPPPEPVVSVLKQDPPSKEFPDESDTFFSKYAGRTYGDPVEGYTNPGKSYVRDVLSSGVKAWNDRPVEGGVRRLTSPEDAESVHRQWIAAERSPVAKLGFQPGKMMQTPRANLTVGGLYDPNTDQSWYDTTNPDHAVHESMHRGLYMIRKAGLLPKDLPSDEMLVRGLMSRHLGDIELGRGAAGDAQIKRARATVKSEVLDAVEAAAANYVAQKRPGGPRSRGGFVQGEERDRGGAAMNPWMAAGGATVASHIPTAPWYERHALRRSPGASKGMLGGASPGRVDNLPIKVTSGSYVVPADIVSAIGQGNSQAGAKMMTKMFSGSKMNKYGGGNFRMKGVPGLQRGQFQEGGMVPNDISGASALGEQNPAIATMSRMAATRAKEQEAVPIIAASGEFIIDPADVLAFGDGNMKRGHDALDEWVKGWRKKHIDTLRKLKDPKKD